MKRITTLLFYIVLIFCCPILGKTQANIADSLALVALHNATDGANWTNPWDLNQPVSTWDGVTLNEAEYVSELDLGGNRLSGDYKNLPPEISNLSQLNYLNLWGMRLDGNIPPEIGNLTNLTYLALNQNNFTGNIPPEIGNLTGLTHLYLYNNQLTGSIPPEIGNLINLEVLNASSSNNLSGSIPAEIGNLTNLIRLDLSGMELSGSIPPEIGNLTNLTDLRLYSNNLTGNIPLEICNLSNLEGLNLYQNELSGNIPPEIACLSNLTHLTLFNNQFSGEIPAELGDLSNLQFLGLRGNELTGHIPPEIGNLSNLIHLGVGFNQLSGCYDSNLSVLCSQLSNVSNWNISDGNNFDATWEDFCATGGGGCILGSQQDSLALVALHNATDGANWTNPWDLNQAMYTWEGLSLNAEGYVAELDLGGNRLSGDYKILPPEIGDLSELTYLNLWGMRLEGDIPPEIGNLTNLTYLALNQNSFTGNIPPEIGNLTGLTHLYLYNNQLSGSIPPEIGNLINLEVLNASSSNNLSGSIPAEIGNLTNLIRLDLAGMELSGNIPPEIGNLTNLTDLRLYSNNLTGNIPLEICNLSSLEGLNLHQNELSGNIPPEIACLSNLTALNLFNNQFSGEIPPEISNLNNLEFIGLRGNELTGNIPPGISNLNNLIHLGLNNNQLSGEIPPGIGNLSYLRSLYLHNNQLNGSIPPGIGSLNNLENLYLNNNQLSGNVSDFSILPVLSHLYIEQNKFSFQDIEDNYDSNNSLSTFQYSPQYYGEPQSLIATLNTTLTLELSDPLPGNNNQNVSYQWKKNDIELAGSTYPTFTISNLQINEVGKYTLHMTDSTRVEDLEVISEPIYVILQGYDLYGQPVVYDQIMMEFDSETDRQFYEDEYLSPNAGWVQDDCSCNRGLYLWQFPSDTVALQILLDINSRTETQTRKAEVDGGSNNIFNLDESDNSGTIWSWTGDYTSTTYQDPVRIFMLDSGLDEGNWQASPYLLPNAPRDVCYNISAPGYDYTDSFTTNYVDSLGHGTFGFRSVVEGFSDYMDVKAVPLKVFNQSGQATLFKFVCALYHAIDHDANVVNISAGYRGQPSEILAKAMQLAQQKDIFIVTAAGNDGENIDSIPQFPAYFSGATYEYEIDEDTIDIPYDNVISVASINAQNSLSTFSNYGVNNTTLVAYGENMSGYGVGGENVVSSGTSISTFYVTRELTAEIAKDKSRSLQDIWSDFEMNRLVSNPPTQGLTKTGKRLDIQIDSIDTFSSYCDAQGTDTNYEFIQSVTLNGQTNNSGNDSGYGNYTSATLATLSGTNTITLTPGFVSNAYAENWAVWIDLNKDGDFDDVGEQVYTGTSTGNTPLSGTFSTPSGTGTTRMRVVMIWDNTPASCDSFIYGEVEDYKVELPPFSSGICGDDTSTLLLLPFDNTLNGLGGEVPTNSAYLSYTAGTYDEALNVVASDIPLLRYGANNNINSQAGSIEAWVKPAWNGNDGQGHAILQYGAGGGILILKDGANNLRLILNRWSLSGYPEVGVAHNISDWQVGQWKHVAFTWGNGIMKLYIDGTLMTQTDYNVTLFPISDAEFNIGTDGGSSVWRGAIDHLRISSLARSQSDIVEFMNNCTGTKLADNYMIDMHNSPNPFTNHTTITYILPQESPVTLIVYDGMGREVALLHDNEIKPTGEHTVHFVSSNYPAGVYYYTIQTGAYSGTQKMILTR